MSDVNSLKFHGLVCRSGKIGWAVEDSFFTILDELDRAGLIDKNNPVVDDVLQAAWLKMATAVYFPRRLRKWAYQFDEAGP